MNNNITTSDKPQKIPAGFDLGNWGAKICLLGLCSKIPAGYSFQQPERINPTTGMLQPPKAFSLKLGKENQILWFGDDALASPQFEGKIDQSKYSPEYISAIFQATLYKWGQQHHQDLAQLGRLEVVVSMPPRFYQIPAFQKQALQAYRSAFNRKQPIWLKPVGKPSIQILTQFGGLVPEATPASRKGFILIVDIGYGTDDYVFLEDGQIKAIKTNANGLLHAFLEIDPINHRELELILLRQKKGLPQAIKAHFGIIQQRILAYTRALNTQPEKVILMGGGATLAKANPATKNLFTKYLPHQVVFLDEFENARINWEKAKNGYI